jgi:hypothetical protein
MVCRPKRSAPRHWTIASTVRVAKSALDAGEDPGLLCEKLRIAVGCEEWMCAPERLEKLKEVADIMEKYFKKRKSRLKLIANLLGELFEAFSDVFGEGELPSGPPGPPPVS